MRTENQFQSGSKVKVLTDTKTTEIDQPFATVVNLKESMGSTTGFRVLIIGGGDCRLTVNMGIG